MTPDFGPSVPFYKVHGCGNDFVAIDNRELQIPVEKIPEWAKKICQRSFGVGTDGIFFLDRSPKGQSVDYIWHFYNSDGSRAEMCGNASRCAARLAYELGIAPAKHVLGTDVGPIHAEVNPESGRVDVQLTPPSDLRFDIPLALSDGSYHVHYVNTGVPHVVLFNENVQRMNVQKLGREIRFHKEFEPRGTNVNFVEVQTPKRMLLRTYERGVEAETYACGTGACAAGVLAKELGLSESMVDLTTSGGEVLGVRYENGEMHLIGAAEIVFSGDLYLNSLGLSI